MGRKKGSKLEKGSSGLDAQVTRMSVDDDGEVNKAESSMALASVDGDRDDHSMEKIDEYTGSDHTSADYYFDSYSHFGKSTDCLLALFFQILVNE